jgi:hypothetical protein
MMSVEEYLRRSADPRWYGEQDENGVDLSLIYENLRLTPHERLIKADQGRVSALALRRIGEEQRARQLADRPGQPAE